MQRWLIFFASLLAWVGSMVYIHQGYAPRPPSPEALANQEALATAFGEAVEKVRSFRIFINPEHPGMAGMPTAGGSLLNRALTSRLERELREERARALALGADPGELEIGTRKTTTKRLGETRVEQRTEIGWQFPKTMEVNSLGPLRAGHVEIRTIVSTDEGLEDFLCKVNLSLEFEILAKGHQDGSELAFVQSVFQGQKKLAEEHLRLPAQRQSLPATELSPFYDRPALRRGDRWQTAILDATSSSGQTVMKEVTLQAGDPVPLFYHGREVHAFAVQASSDRFRGTAWYSASGRVLKEQWLLLELLKITSVREEDD